MKFPKLRYAYSVEQAAEWADEWHEALRKRMEEVVADSEGGGFVALGSLRVAKEVLEWLKE